MENEKVTFLFGAGADMDAYERMPEGKSFAKVLLHSSNYDNRKSLLGESCARYKLVNHNSINVFLQTIDENRVEAERIFGNEMVEEYCKYYKGEVEDKEKKRIGDDVRENCRNWYYSITERDSKKKQKPIYKQMPEEQRSFFLNHAVFFDSLDGRFNALRHKDLDSRGKRVINAYTMIFVEMMKSRYDLGDDFDWTWKNVFSILNEKENGAVKEEWEKKKKSYYSILSTIKGNKENEEKDYYVATTNYTDIAETVIGEKSIYLHGNLSWFEDYERLVVYDCTIKEERETALERAKKHMIFPYIMIPSGVKPLICQKQIEEYHKFIDALNKSDKLCVVGYKFNKEDNHINSIIGEWLRQGDRKLYYYYFKEDNFKEDKKAREEAINALPACIQDGNSFKDSGNIIINLICQENCHDKFEKFVGEHLLID